MIDHANHWWSAIANAIEEGYVAIDLHGQVIAWNQSALKILHISETQIQDTAYWKSTVIQPLAVMLQERQDFSGKEISLHFERGSTTWLRTNGRHLITDTDNGYILTFTDITKWIDTNKSERELRHTKDKLEESQKVFESVFNYSPTGIGLIGPDGKWMDVNESLMNTLGFTREELKATDIADIIHPDDRESAVNQIIMMLNGEINTYRAERRYMHKDGHYIWVFLAASLLWYADGTPRFFIIQMVDVTELKHLNTEAQTKNIILHATSVDLRQKIKQLQEFNRIIAHNLGGPATALVASTDLLPEITEENDRSRLLQHMKATAEAILYTLKDLKQVLDLKENNEVPFTECDLEALIQQKWGLLNPLIEKKKAALYLDLQVDTIFYGKAYLENILFNLLNNALIYTRPDVPPQIHVSCRKEEKEIVLEVRDNGMGIDLDKHGTQIFRYKKIFHRGLSGEGVGLFMIRNQIKTFGGNIKAKSEEGKGSSFFVYFNNNREPILKQDEQD
ncbi:PAS domain S-box protein [Chitinophaga oryziterrae]|uniref:histidine kinase n=2 Tax=Chitinophaga oryziterrae TaxID=1031224 RepID=A0A6N8JC87_9BACT|nr:PAS domain S-box protein [Chitinophaga oryziterrae]MVT41869.1 PAS domain S-box protein [Chitinophaga oryziterrae]